MLQSLLPSWIRPYRRGDERRIEPPDPARLLAVQPFLDRLERYLGYSVRGLEHIPRSGPALVVSHHPYCTVGSLLLSKRVMQRDGRTFRGLTQHEAFLIPGLRDLFSSFGIIDGNQTNAERLLQSGQVAFCMPGGALEWSRSSRLKRRLRWGTHQGYARLAVRLGLPVIPVACPAADDLFWVFADGTKVSRVLQAILRTERPLMLPLAVGWGPLPFRVRLTHYVSPPIPPSGQGSQAEQVEALDRAVRARMRELLRRD